MISISKMIVPKLAAWVDGPDCLAGVPEMSTSRCPPIAFPYEDINPFFTQLDSPRALCLKQWYNGFLCPLSGTCLLLRALLVHDQNLRFFSLNVSVYFNTFVVLALTTLLIVSFVQAVSVNKHIAALVLILACLDTCHPKRLYSEYTERQHDVNYN